MIRSTTFTIATLLAMAVLVLSCKGDKRSEALVGDNVIRASNDAGVEIAVTNVRQHRRFLVLNLDITNNGETAVELRNPGDHMRGFTVEANGRSVAASARHGGHMNPWTGYHAGSVSSAAGVMELPSESTAGLELHFRWPKPYHDRHDYDWTLTVSQMYNKDSDEALPAITHHEKHPTADRQ